MLESRKSGDSFRATASSCPWSPCTGCLHLQDRVSVWEKRSLRDTCLPPDPCNSVHWSHLSGTRKFCSSIIGANDSSAEFPSLKAGTFSLAAFGPGHQGRQATCLVALRPVIVRLVIHGNEDQVRQVLGQEELKEVQPVVLPTNSLIMAWGSLHARADNQLSQERFAP